MEEKEKSIFEEGQVLLFNKPLYWTSFDLVNKIRLMLRNSLGLKKIKVGHAGTLDPLATGLMIVCTGKATKRIIEFCDLDKEYVAKFYFGKTTPSYDLETETNGEYPVDHITKDLMLSTLDEFMGEQKQVPPMHSAKFIDGKRAYEYARKGIHKDIEPVKVIFSEIELITFGIPESTIRIRCSKGTYIRSFAMDLGVALKSGCYLSALERTSIGQFKVIDSNTLEIFGEKLEVLKQNT